MALISQWNSFLVLAPVKGNGHSSAKNDAAE